jgi:tetratricopeptide (TPR) repeat protein
MQYLRKIQEMNPRDPDSYYYIADLYGEMDQVDEAINTLQYGLLQTDDDSALLYLLTYAYFVKGSRQQALEALNRALEADFEAWPDFIEYDKELLANDVDIIALIEEHKKKHEAQSNNE